MAMYYQAGSSEQIQGDGLQTLYLMNPNYVGYNPDNTHHHHQPLLITSTAVPHATLNQFVGIPISHDPSRPSSSSVLGPQEDIQPGPPTAIPRFHYGTTWGSIDQSDNVNQPNMPQGLSLSLSPHKTGFHKAAISNQDCRAGPGVIPPRVSTSTGADDMQSVILGSKYLKAAQELLDEVAGVGDAPKGDRPDEAKNKAKMITERVDTIGEASGGGTELTTAQRQEIQMKRAKLCSMLDEVDQRYKQYHQQMQIIVASFEQAAGIGSAKSYTQLALKTILKQFKCLKTAISAQIKALSKSLGEEDKSLSEKLDGSRLKFVDHQMRQQRAFQHLGMMQNNNAWRPQRGLPEKAVSVLRAWLFEHFLHPYPKDSDKHMLAKQTGLTRSQVSNWFINARVRLWKPMVEEMYVEEMKNQDQIPTDEKATKAGKESASEFTDNNITTATMAQLSALQSRQNKNLLNLVNPSPDKISGSTITTNSPSTGFAHRITSLNMEKNPKKPRNDQNSSPSSILSVERETGRKEFMTNVMFGRPDGENFLSAADANTGPGFGNYGIPAGNSFPGNSNFSLTLALPPSEGSQRAHQQNYLSHRNFEFGTRIGEGAVGSGGVDDQGDSHPNIGYEILDFQNRKQFPAQLLHDYVA